MKNNITYKLIFTSTILGIEIFILLGLSFIFLRSFNFNVMVLNFFIVCIIFYRVLEFGRSKK